MLKQLLQFRTLLIALLVMAGAGNGWGQTTTATINFKSKGGTNISAASVTGNDSQGNTWTITTVGTTSFTPMPDYCQVGSSSKPATSITFTTTLADDVNITSFSAKFGGFSGTAGTVTLKVGDTSVVGTGSLNGTSDVTVNSTSSAIGKVLTVTVTGISKGVKAYNISYTYEPAAADNRTAVNLTSFEATTTILTVGETTTTTATNDQSGWTEAYTYSSSNSDVASVDASGVITANATGSATITCSLNVDDNDVSYKVGTTASKTIDITVVNPPYTVTFADGGSVTETSGGAGVTLPSRDPVGAYTFAGWSTDEVVTETTTAPTTIIPAGSYNPTDNVTLYPVYTKGNKTASVSISDYATENSWSDATQYTSVVLDENVKALGSSNDINSKYYTNDKSWRFYASTNPKGKVTISVSNGTLTGVTFTHSGTLQYNNSNITSGSEVSVSGTSAEFVCTANAKITAISVDYSVSGSTTTYWSRPVAAAVECPVITVEENPFLFSTTATITCATEGAAIQYSYDNENWTDYTEPLTLTQTTTINAKATKGSDESTVATVTATKNLAAPTVAVTGELTLDLNGGTSVSAGTLSAAVTYNDKAIPGAAVTWESSAPEVATIDANGEVTLLTTGTVTFTATYAANSDYASATGTMTVTVVDKNVPGSTQQNPYTVAQALANTPASGNYSSTVFVHGIVSSFYKNDIMSDGTSYRYNISDDGKMTSELLVYKGKGLGNVDFRSTDDLQVGDTIIITGQLTTYNSIKEFAAENYIVSQKCKKKDAKIDVKESEISYGTTFSVDDTMIEGGEISLSSSNPAVATVNGLNVIPKAVGTTTITVSTAPSMRYNAGSETFTLKVTAPEGKTTAALFNETFDNSTGTAGWSGSSANGTLVFDNKGWVSDKGYGNDGSAKFGTSSAQGYAITPALGEAGDLTLSFKAAAWNGDKTDGGLILSIEEGEGTLVTSTFTLVDSQWSSYKTTIKGATAATKIKFSAAQSSKNRFFLDDVVVTKEGAFLTAKLNASGYATYCSEYPLNFSNAKGYSAWQVTGVGGNAITFEKVTGSVKGGTGLLLMGEPSDTVTLTSVDSETVLETNKLIGTLAPTYVDVNEYYGLSGQQFLKVNPGTVKAGKALLPASVVENAGNVRTLSLVFVDPTTGIAETKTMEAEEGIYNLQGQRIGKAQRGVNIIGGKKVLVK